jgi:hypothetical protein
MSEVRSPEELEILWMMLDLEFFKLPPASHHKVATQVIEWILWRERLRNNLEGSAANQRKSDKKTIAILNAMDTNDPKLLMLEKVFRRLVNGRGEDAMHLLQVAIQNKHNAVSERQRRIAKAPRKKAQHPISIMIGPIVEKNPKIKINALFYELRANIKNNDLAECQFDFSKEIFIPRNAKWHSVKRENLSDYLLRAKQRIKRANRLE